MKITTSFHLLLLTTGHQCHNFGKTFIRQVSLLAFLRTLRLHLRNRVLDSYVWKDNKLTKKNLHTHTHRIVTPNICSIDHSVNKYQSMLDASSTNPPYWLSKYSVKSSTEPISVCSRSVERNLKQEGTIR